jgi:hypothetical protein
MGEMKYNTKAVLGQKKTYPAPIGLVHEYNWDKEFVLDVENFRQPVRIDINNGKGDAVGSFILVLDNITREETTDVNGEIEYRIDKAPEKSLRAARVQMRRSTCSFMTSSRNGQNASPISPLFSDEAIDSLLADQINIRAHIVDYSNLIDIISKNFMSVTRVICTNIVDDELAESLLTIFEGHPNFKQLMYSALYDEVHRTQTVETLFRVDSMATKLMKKYTRKYGSAWIIETLRPITEKLCEKDVNMEVDPDKIKSNSDRLQNVDKLKLSVDAFMSAIVASEKTCPLQVRELCRMLVHVVKTKFPQLGTRVIGGFLFLRVICPAITSPLQFGLVDTDPPQNAKRHLVLIAKLIQLMANGNNLRKEKWVADDFEQYLLRRGQDATAFCDAIAKAPSVNPRDRADSPLSEWTSGSTINGNNKTGLPHVMVASQAFSSAVAKNAIKTQRMSQALMTIQALDSLAKAISKHIEVLHKALSSDPLVAGLLSAEIEMKFSPLFEIQDKL